METHYEMVRSFLHIFSFERMEMEANSNHVILIILGWHFEEIHPMFAGNCTMNLHFTYTSN